MRISQTNNVNNLYQEIGQNIKEARKNREMTQEELAIKIGLTRTSIVNLENGNQNISLQTLFNISNTLKLNVVSLLPKTNHKEKMNNIQVRELRVKLYTLIKYVNHLEKTVKTLKTEIKNIL